MSKKPRQDELGGLKWLLVIWVLLYGVFSLLTWPFRLALKHLPGRREKLLRAEIAEMRAAVRSARQLVAVLGTGAPELESDFEDKVRSMDKGLDELLEKHGWVDDIEGETPWSIAIDILERADRLGAIDWKASPAELKKAFAPLLRTRHASIDWAFLRQLERDQNWEALKNENLLPVVAGQLAASGHILAQIDDGSDNYNVALCTADEFARIEPLASGAYAVRRFREV